MNISREQVTKKATQFQIKFTQFAPSIVIYLCAIQICSSILHCCVYYFIRNQKRSPTKFSLVNCGISSFLSFFIEILAIMKDLGIITVSEFWSCKLWAFSRRAIIALLSFTTVSVFAEISRQRTPLIVFQSGRIHYLKPPPEFNYQLKSTICVWVVTFLLAFPSLSTYDLVVNNQVHRDRNNIMNSNNNYTTTDTDATCRKVLIFDSKVISILYEFIGGVATSVAPSAYIIYVLRSLKFRLQYLFCCKNVPLGLKSHIRRIRFVFFYAVWYILFWMSLIMLVAYAKSSSATLSSKLSPARDYFEQNPNVYLFSLFIFIIILSFQPILYLYAHFGV